MVRTSSALFIPGAEALVLSMGFYFAASALMDQTMPSDFSPAMRSVLFSQLLLVLLSMSAHLVLAVVDKSQFVLPKAEPTEAAAAAEGGGAAALLALISQRMDYRYYR